jgi:hypothetical protein
MRRGAWIVVGGKGGGAGECERCGAVLEIELPKPLYLVAAMMEAFVKLHLNCKAPISAPEAKP